MKVILAQCNFTIGDLENNSDKIIKYCLSLKTSDLIVFSELCITGYPPLDLIEQKQFVDKQYEQISRICYETKHLDMGIVIGYVKKNNFSNKLNNSLGLIYKGELIYSYDKQRLPTYNIFDEARHFIPTKSDGIFKFKGENIKFLICEDAWEDKGKFYDLNPFDAFKDNKFDLIVSINASPSEIGKRETRELMYWDICRRYSIPIIYVNQTGSNDDIVFDGNSFALDEYGGVITHLKAFEEDCAIIDTKSNVGSYASVHSCLKANNQSDVEVMYEHVKLGIKDYVHKCGFKGVVVGSSGGIDSAIILSMCSDALGKDNVRAITMPTQFSSEGSWKDSEKLCNNLGITLYTRNIQEEYEMACTNFCNTFGEVPSRVTKENIQARIRGRILMEFSNHYGNLVISTGNKSEMAVGYSSIYGDLCGGLAPISDLYKMQVYALSRYYNKLHGKEIIPLEIINKEPSAELSEGQKDSDNLPEYPILDAILKLHLEGDLLSSEEQFELTGKLILHKDAVTKVLKLVKNNEFKRRQAPPTIRVNRRAWGSGRRYPIAQKFNFTEL